MRISRPLVTATAAAALVAGAAVAGAPATTAAPVKASDSAGSGVKMMKVKPTVFRARTNTDGKVTSVRPSARVLAGPTTAKFQVTYHGFSKQAKASFQRAVNYWSKTMTSTVPIKVDATYKALGPGILGSAGPQYIWKNFPKAPKNVFYVDALADKIAKKDVATLAGVPGSPDIVANFSSAFDNWYFGTGNAPVGKYDFQSVVTHEIGHGLGFLGAGYVSNGKGTVKFADNNGVLSPSTYDRYTENAAGKKLTTYPNASSALAAQLQSNKVFFDSPLVRKANKNKPAKLFAPKPFQPGSSYSHFDDNTFKKGNKDSLMTPYLDDGETIRSAGPVTMALFKTTGW